MKEDFFAYIIIILAFTIPLILLVNLSFCDLDSDECLLRIEPLMPDFYWHHNIIKYVASHGDFPDYVLGYEDGGESGDSLYGKTKPVLHSPLYYYIAAGVLILSKKFSLNPLLNLHILSLLFTLVANIFFYFFTKKISAGMYKKNRFTISAIALSVFLPINLYMGLAIHNHAFFYAMAMLSLYLFALFNEKNSLFMALAFGIILGVSLLSNLIGITLLVALLIYIAYIIHGREFNEARLLIISLLIGSFIGAFVLARNYILFGEFIWAGLFEPVTRNAFVLLHVLTSYFGGVYGRIPFIFPLAGLASLFVLIVSVFGFFNPLMWKKDLQYIWIIGILTLIFGFNTVCSVFSFFKTFSCTGNIVHGRYFLLANPLLILFFSSGFARFIKNKKIFYFILALICTLYLIDFMYAFF